MSSAVQQSLQLCLVTFHSNSACLSILDNWTFVDEDDMVSKTQVVERNAFSGKFWAQSVLLKSAITMCRLKQVAVISGMQGPGVK